LGEDLRCNVVGFAQLSLKRNLDFRVRRSLIESFQPMVVGEQIELENMQSVEFIEQVSRGIRSGSKRIVWMELLPGLEGPMSCGKVQVVHRPKPSFQRVGGRFGSASVYTMNEKQHSGR